MICIAFVVCLNAMSGLVVAAAYNQNNVADEEILVYYAPFAEQYYTEPAVDTIETKATSVFRSSSNTYFGRQLKHHLDVGIQEGFWAYSKASREFDTKNVRAKILYGCDVYHVDYHGVILGPDNRSYQVSRDTLAGISQLLYRFQGTSDQRKMSSTVDNSAERTSCDRKKQTNK